MSKKGRRVRTVTAPTDPAPLATDPLPFPALPRSVSELDPAHRERFRELIEASADLERQRAVQARLVGALRDVGLPWSAIGWAVGTSGEAARQRWG